MEFGYLDLKTAAARLHMDALELKHFAQREEVPSQKRGEDFFFERRLLDEWAQRRMIGLHPRQLTDEHAHAMSERAKSTGEVRIADLLAIEAIAPALSAKNKGGVLRDMTELADATGKVYDKDALFKGLSEREEAASTAVGGGAAFLHVKFHDEYLVSESFLALGRTTRPVFFGAPDDGGTDLFFLINCKALPAVARHHASRRSPRRAGRRNHARRGEVRRGQPARQPPFLNRTGRDGITSFARCPRPTSRPRRRQQLRA